MSVLSTSAESLRRAEARVQQIAERLASLPLSPDPNLVPEDSVNLSAQVVELMEAKRMHLAAVTVMKTAAEVDQHILDVLA